MKLHLLILWYTVARSETHAYEHYTKLPCIHAVSASAPGTSTLAAIRSHAGGSAPRLRSAWSRIPKKQYTARRMDVLRKASPAPEASLTGSDRRYEPPTPR